MSNNVRKLALVFALALLLASVASISITWAAAGANSPSLAGAAAPLGKAGLTPYLQQTDGLTINDIVGASHIPTTGELIVIGQVLNDPNRPAIDYDYIKENLVVAMRAVHSAPDDPAATIDPIPGNPNSSYHQVKSFGNITNTHYVRFRATNDYSNPTAFYVDDVSLDIDPMETTIQSGGDVYLPIIIKPALADLYVQNNIGKTLNLTINGVGSRSIPPSAAGSPYHWGLFLAGTYSWRATASGFSPATGTEYFPEGPSLMTFGIRSSVSRPGSQADGNGELIMTLEP
jgi:hypothetical protein